MQSFFVFENIEECKLAISRINERKGFSEDKSTKTWCQPHKNQTEE